VAGQYKRNRLEFDLTARQWVATYARDLEEVQQEKIAHIIEMGFEEAVARRALENTGWERVWL
jgi:hypothetical protein